jgi:outer membrane protein assembly factor BamB
VNMHLVTFVIAAFLMTGCHSPDNPGDRASAKPAAIVDIPANSFAVQWVAPLKLDHGDALNHLYQRGDVVLVYTRSNHVTALAASGGQILWGADVAGRGDTIGPPLVMKDQIIFPTSTSLTIFKGGKKDRVIDIGHPIRSAPAGENNIVYVGLDYASGGRIAKLDITKRYNQTIWELMASGGMSSAPVLFQQVVYTASENGYVYAVSEDRLPVWPLPGSAFKTDGRVLADIKVDEFGVYAASTDSKLYCLDRASGKIKWQYFGGAPLRTAPVVIADTVYQTVPGVGVAAIDKTAGDYDRKPRWLVRGTTQFLSEDATNAYLRTNDNLIVAVNKKTGEQKFKSKRQDLRLFATSEKPDGIVYAATINGDVYAIRPALKAGTVGELVQLPATVEPEFCLSSSGL